MIPSELKLASLSHCYIHLPEKFLSSQQNFLPGSTVSIRSVQNETELIVMWNGVNSGAQAQLDLNFAQANNLRDELVVLSLADKIQFNDCTHCRVELVDSSDYAILSQHTDANVLDSCRLINRGLIIPIFLSQHVRVLVKVLSFEPDNEFGLLTKWTEMSFIHSSKPIPTQVQNQHEIESKIVDPIAIISANLGIEARPPFHLGNLLVYGNRGTGKTYYLKCILKKYSNFNSKLINCQLMRGKRPEAIRKTLNELLSEAFNNQPSVLALDDIDSLISSDQKHDDEQGQEAIYRKRLVDLFCQLIKQIERSDDVKGNRVVVIASCQSLDSLDERVSKSRGRTFFNEIVKLNAPNLQQKCDILKSIITEQKQLRHSITDAQLEEIARKCKSFMPSDLRKVIERAIIAACSRSTFEFNSDPLTLQYDDLSNCLDGYVPHNLRSVSLQCKTHKTFDHVGGMKSIKDELMKTIILQIKYPKLYRKCPLGSGSSILLYGPPGCGKTLIAEALTNQESINSIYVRGPELLSKYIGASEAAVRDLFKRAELARPCVIFFDEFESLVSKRGSDSTGVTDRVVNQFLTLMDGVERLSSDVFLIGASSRPDMIDPAILRPGRLDKHIYCPMPSVEDRLEILEVLSKEMNIDKRNVIIPKWAKRLDKFSGADIQSFLYSSQLKALHDIVGPTDFSSAKQRQRHAKQSSNFEIIVNESHLKKSFDEMKSDIAKKSIDLETKYPKKFGRTPIQAASRATLA